MSSVEPSSMTMICSGRSLCPSSESSACGSASRSFRAEMRTASVGRATAVAASGAARAPEAHRPGERAGQGERGHQRRGEEGGGAEENAGEAVRSNESKAWMAGTRELIGLTASHRLLSRAPAGGAPADNCQ